MKNQYSGAGVVVLENDKFGTNIILVRDTHKNSYTEPGGKYDHKHGTIHDAAKDELYEETSALFYAKNNKSINNNNNHFDKKYRKKKYRVYFILLSKPLRTLKKDYNNNTKILSSNIYLFNGDSSFRETDDIVKVNLYDIYNILSLNHKVQNVWVKDIRGKNIKLHKRTARILRMYFFDDFDRNFKVKTVSLKKRKESFDSID